MCWITRAGGLEEGKEACCRRSLDNVLIGGRIREQELSGGKRHVCGEEGAGDGDGCGGAVHGCQGMADLGPAIAADRAVA